MAADGGEILRCALIFLILVKIHSVSVGVRSDNYRDTYFGYIRRHNPLLYNGNQKENDLTPRMTMAKSRHDRHQQSSQLSKSKHLHVTDEIADVQRQLDTDTEYERFYLNDNPSVIPSQEIVDDFYAAFKRDTANDLLPLKNEKLKHLKAVTVDVSVMDRLWHAIRDGTLPLEENLSSKQRTYTARNHAAVIKSLVVTGSIIEIGTGATLLHLAKLFNNVTCVGVVPNGEFADTVVHLAVEQGLSNLYVTHTTSEQLMTVSESLYYNPQILFGNLLLTNLTSLVGTLLPHEFEELIGRLLSLSSKSFVTGLHIEDANRAYFEQSWLSVGDLVQRGCQVANLRCVTRDVTWSVTPGGGLAGGWTRPQVLEVRVTQGVRTLEDATCQKKRPDTQCQLHFGDDVAKTTVLFSDNTKEEGPPPGDAIPFYVLTDLGATDYTRSQLFLGALDLPFAVNRSPKSLAVQGANVKHDFPLWTSESTLDDYARPVDDDRQQDLGHHERQDAFDSTLGISLQPLLEKVTERPAPENIPSALPPASKNNSVSIYSLPAVGVWNPKSDKADNLADSQVDGVAQGWNRVYNKQGAEGRQEEQQYQSMGKHWDRENVDSLPGDPLQTQEKRELARFDLAWERELPLLGGGRKKDGAVSQLQDVEGEKKGEAGVGGSENGKSNADSVLRRDEKELRRAMGFLHGETDVRGMEALVRQHHRRHQQATTTTTTTTKPSPVRTQQSQSTVTPRPRSTSTTFSSSHILSRPGRRSSTHPQRAKHVLGDARLKFRPLAKPAVITRDEQPPPRPAAPKAAVRSAAKAENLVAAEREELERILRDDSAAEKEDSNQIKTVDHKNRDPRRPDPRDDVVKASFKKQGFDVQNEILDGIDLGGQEYVGVDKEKDLDDTVIDRREYEGEGDQNIPQLGGVVDNYHLGLLFQPDSAGENGYSDTQREEINIGMDQMSRDGKGANDGKENGLQDPEAQLEDGDIPGGQEVVDEHLYDEVKLDYGVVPDKNKRRLLSQGLPDGNVQAELRDMFKGLPNRYRKKLENALHAKVTSTGRKPAFMTEADKQLANRGEMPEAGHEESLTQSVSLKSTTRERHIKDIKEESSSPGKGHNGDGRGPESQPGAFKPQSVSFGSAHGFGPTDREEALFDHQWRTIWPQIQGDMGTRRHPFNVLTYGSRSQSLLGLKVARAYPAAHVLSLMPTRGLHGADHQRRVMGSVGADNVVLLTADLSPALVDTLSRSPDLARYQMLGMEVYEWLPQLPLGFPFYLGRLLSLASVSFLELPDPRQLEMLLAYFKHNTDDVASDIQTTFKGVVRESLRLVNAENSTLTLLRGYKLRSHSHIKILKVHIHTMKRPVQVDCGTGMAYLSLRPPGVVHLTSHTSQTEVRLDRAQRAFSLHLLLEAGLRDQPLERSRLFAWYLRQSLHQDMCPLHVIWHNSSLVYRPLFSSNMPLNMAIQHTRSFNAQASLKALQREQLGERFSFMEYGSRSGELLLSLAETYPSSSVLSLVDEDAKVADSIYQRAMAAGLGNLIVLNTTVNERLSAKLLYSPEFLRYQYIGLETFLRLVSGFGSRQQFDLFIGQTLATAGTTFIQVPSDQMLSLAMSTFFPQSYSGQPRSEKHDPQVYYLSEHPRPVYMNSEKRLIGESAKADVDIEVSVRAIPPPKGVTSEQLPWKLMRVDVKNLTIEVNHHFDYQLDGHGRKYTLHCERANRTAAPRVWLVRLEDGLHIPYGSVHVISLIALLRMGLLEEIKTQFYDKFLKLPYYEDMAPWNIVFDAGNLTYIDYDSRNVTFNKLAPAAFQVIFMLLNYERTVKDFGKCHHHAKINYGISVVGRCVGSKFLGPCMDNKTPVPCGDGSCRSTYMECLKALQALEREKQARLDTVTQNLHKGQTTLLPKDSPFDKDTWRFGSNGIIKQGERLR